MWLSSVVPLIRALLSAHALMDDAYRSMNALSTSGTLFTLTGQWKEGHSLQHR